MNFFISFIKKIKATMAYIALIPIVNMILIHMPVFHLTSDIHYTPASMLAGLVYVARDFTQRELGHRLVFIPMLIAAAVTYMLGSPAMASASLAAFVCGELTEWAVYTYTRKPFSQRILLSCSIALPVDIIIVLIGLHFAAPGLIPINPGNMSLMYGNNMISVIIAYLLVRRLEKKNVFQNG